MTVTLCDQLQQEGTFRSHCGFWKQVVCDKMEFGSELDGILSSLCGKAQVAAGEAEVASLPQDVQVNCLWAKGGRLIPQVLSSTHCSPSFTKMRYSRAVLSL